MVSNLPISISNAEPGMMYPEDNTKKALGRVLVVEDDQSIRRMLRFSLRDAGFNISEASTGKEALQTLEKDVPAAVVLDLGLPDSLGGAVLEWLRQPEHSAVDSPVWVVISALDQEDVVKQYGPLDRHFLAKPFNPWDLVMTLAELLAEKRNPESSQI
jgi:two-component system, OmpR family, KDP operon response regulator KdpE